MERFQPEKHCRSRMRNRKTRGLPEQAIPDIQDQFDLQFLNAVHAAEDIPSADQKRQRKVLRDIGKLYAEEGRGNMKTLFSVASSFANAQQQEALLHGFARGLVSMETPEGSSFRDLKWRIIAQRLYVDSMFEEYLKGM